MIPYLLNRAMWIAIVAGLLGALLTLNAYDQDVEQARLEAYCADAALWAYEEAKGVPLNRRAGQPDYRGIAAEQCPGMWPAGYDTERQLAQQ